MKLRIFYFEEVQKEQHKWIMSAFQKYLCGNIQPDPRILTDETVTKAEGKEYLGLLRSATLPPPVLKPQEGYVDAASFAISVEDKHGSFQYLGGYYQNGVELLGLLRDKKPNVVPAVAIMNRMVMVPSGIEEAFGGSSGLKFFFRPLSLQGSAYVNFADRKDVDRAVADVSRQIHQEIVELGRRMRFVQKSDDLGMDKLDKLLMIDDQDYLNTLHDEICWRPMELASEIGSCKLTSKIPLRLQVRIAVHANSDQVGIVRFQFKTPQDVTVEPRSGELNFSSACKQTIESCEQAIEFSLMPVTQPYCPFELTLTLCDPRFPDQSFRSPFVLDVREGGQ